MSTSTSSNTYNKDSSETILQLALHIHTKNVSNNDTDKRRKFNDHIEKNLYSPWVLINDWCERRALFDKYINRKKISAYDSTYEADYSFKYKEIKEKKLLRNKYPTEYNVNF